MSVNKSAHPAADERVPLGCCDCHQPFLALGAWQIRCRSCYHAWKIGRATPALAAEIERLRAENAALTAELAQARSEAAQWRRLAHAAPRKRPVRAWSSPTPIPADQWRRIVQCCHPDRHGGSASAVEATRWLLENRP